jgi:hypothetical protein
LKKIHEKGVNDKLFQGGTHERLGDIHIGWILSGKEALSVIVGSKISVEHIRRKSECLFEVEMAIITVLDGGGRLVLAASLKRR